MRFLKKSFRNRLFAAMLLCSLILGACIWIFDAVVVNFFQMLISVLGG